MKILYSTLIALIWHGEAIGHPYGLIIDETNGSDRDFIDALLTCVPEYRTSVISSRKILLYDDTQPVESDTPTTTILITEYSGVPSDIRQSVDDELISIGYSLPE